MKKQRKSKEKGVLYDSRKDGLEVGEKILILEGGKHIKVGGKKPKTAREPP